MKLKKEHIYISIMNSSTTYVFILSLTFAYIQREKQNEEMHRNAFCGISNTLTN